MPSIPKVPCPNCNKTYSQLRKHLKRGICKPNEPTNETIESVTNNNYESTEEPQEEPTELQTIEPIETLPEVLPEEPKEVLPEIKYISKRQKQVKKSNAQQQRRAMERKRNAELEIKAQMFDKFLSGKLQEPPKQTQQPTNWESMY